MEQINLNNILLSDAGLKYEFPFYATLKKYNIKTVYQLLYSSTMDDIINNAHEKTRNALLGFIDLVKYKYLQTTLPLYHRLDTKPQKIKTLDKKEFIEYPCDFSRMGFDGRQTFEILNAINILYKKNIIDEDTKLVDCFKNILMVDFGPFHQKSDGTCELIKAYVRIYNSIVNPKKINLQNENDDILVQQLEKKLTELLQERDKIDIQINAIYTFLNSHNEKDEDAKRL